MTSILPDGYAVRLDWPVARHGGVRHEFTQFTTSLRRALRRAVGTQRYWATGPVRPLAVTVVPIGRADYDAHGRDCASLTCPTMAPLLGLAPAGAVEGTALPGPPS
ncbi:MULTISPECIES: hypothetical protein [Dactylosporangium]|uniref:Uncharacterized protein n=2 Tax=Dactylosporangium TaxID=35753 RepID=A0A9W6NQL2_9ACTN|nr:MULTISPECIES: hypothetical protein [Dactylosporangium]UAB99245.1 hypothetical protein Dvina_14885 [Dactylosporangium vinaceum]UWZ47475.1 hypothetical protein Dmats_14345 [Dactylosporangium matsuzakiense]GLL05232.1 hypothetical protein GCM10017581_069790 [Dactylosporangium matsuzakiense]